MCYILRPWKMSLPWPSLLFSGISLLSFCMQMLVFKTPLFEIFFSINFSSILLFLCRHSYRDYLPGVQLQKKKA